MSCPSSIQHLDLNPQPLEHESSPITTRPGLPPIFLSLFVFVNSMPCLLVCLLLISVSVLPSKNQDFESENEKAFIFACTKMWTDSAE